jgi:hypothetical protein
VKPALAPDDDEAHEITDALDEKIEVAYELGDWMLADHLERVRRQFAWAMSGAAKTGGVPRKFTGRRLAAG